MTSPAKPRLSSLFPAATLILASVFQSISANEAQTRPTSLPLDAFFKVSQSSAAAALSEKQKLQLRVVQRLTSNKILAVLTPAQREIIQQAAQSEKTPVSVEAELKLTPEQKRKISAIKAESQKQAQSILISK